VISRPAIGASDCSRTRNARRLGDDRKRASSSSSSSSSSLLGRRLERLEQRDRARRLDHEPELDPLELELGVDQLGERLAIDQDCALAPRSCAQARAALGPRAAMPRIVGAIDHDVEQTVERLDGARDFARRRSIRIPAQDQRARSSSSRVELPR
jgi:hypothetical protein